ncbi:MAG: hypothetical protein MUE42_05235 [Opitutaceae bacterium]|nr:hypothetical protein [Opitutaceae bacterium]
MNIILLSCGLGGELAVHQVHHQIGTARSAPPRPVHLLVLDARRMSPDCFAAACKEISVIRDSFGLNHGVLLCHAPTLPLTVAAIRSGLRDIIYQHITAARLRSMAQAANPGTRLTVKEFDALAAFLRTFTGLSGSNSPVADIAARENELARKAEQLAALETRLTFEKEALENRDRDLRDRTRRFERQLAMQQNDADIAPASHAPRAGSNPPLPELEAMARKLEQRAAELDFREKLLLEMQTILTAAGAPLGAAPAKK